MVATPEQLVQRARERAGLSDLGPDGWQESLGRLLAAVDADLGDDHGAVASIEELLVGRLVTRLTIENWYAQHGDEASAPIERPLVIIGLPRTATTALHYLLAVDPRFRYPRAWELKQPVPPPDLATEPVDPRRQATQASVQHIVSVDGPAEDGNIHALAFRHAEMSLPVPSYTRWWRSTTHPSAFEYHERMLRMLHAHRPPHRWLLKFPNYMFQLADVVDRYPDAQFVMTHRDLQAVIPSACSVIGESRRQRVPSWSPDPVGFGREVLDHLTESTTREIAGRAELGADRFLDVAQFEIEHDPVATVERIAAFAGIDLDDDLRTAMAQWSDDNRRGSRGEHRYDASEYGLTPEQIDDGFAEYLSVYGDLCRAPV